MLRPKSAPLETFAPAHNFTITLEDRMRAASGAPAYIRRKRRIEDLEEDILATLIALLDEVRATQLGDRDAVSDAEVKRRFGAEKILLFNDLIARHNRYYPIEANLPLDPRSGVTLDELGSPWAPLPAVTFEEFFARAKVRCAAEHT